MSLDDDESVELRWSQLYRQKCWAVNPMTMGMSDYKHTRLTL